MLQTHTIFGLLPIQFREEGTVEKHVGSADKSTGTRATSSFILEGDVEEF